MLWYPQRGSGSRSSSAESTAVNNTNNGDRWSTGVYLASNMLPVTITHFIQYGICG